MVKWQLSKDKLSSNRWSGGVGLGPCPKVSHPQKGVTLGSGLVGYLAKLLTLSLMNFSCRPGIERWDLSKQLFQEKNTFAHSGPSSFQIVWLAPVVWKDSLYSRKALTTGIYCRNKWEQANLFICPKHSRTNGRLMLLINKCLVNEIFYGLYNLQATGRRPNTLWVKYCWVTLTSSSHS